MPECKERNLNRSQLRIAASERTFAGSALNTISVRVHIPGFSAIQVKSATDAVMEKSDVFTAKLAGEGRSLVFVPHAAPLRPCVVLNQATCEDAKRYAEEQDVSPLVFPKELYQAEVFPLSEGGAMLYVRFHHIITDGYGMNLFVEKVLQTLEGRAVDNSVFFSDSSDSSEEEPETGKNESFWRDYFKDADFESGIYPDSPSGLKRTVFRCAPEEELQQAIALFAARTGVTVSYVFAAAYALYLAESTGKRDAVFFMPRLNRNRAQMQTIGCYTLLVPVRVRIAQDEPFSDLCQRVMESAREASLHKEIEYERLLQILREENYISDTPAEYVLNFYRYVFDTKVEFDLDISVAGAMHNHFTWNIFQENGGLSFRFDLRERVYDHERAFYFADGVETVLRAGLQDSKIREIPVVGERERTRLMQMRGETIALDEKESIPSLFKKAAAYGARPAVYAGDKTLTFRELDDISDRIAGALLDKGVSSDACVAFMLPRDVRLIPAMLGIAKTGAAFIPVDPAYPRDRIRYILEDSGASFLISSADVSAAKNETFLDIDALTNAQPRTVRLPQIRQAQTAYMIYTSGTTGKPKGVMLSHRGIVNIVHPDNNPFNRDMVKNGKGIVAIGSICFDISLFEIFVPLLNGLFVELGSEKAMTNASELAALIRRHGADILHCTPSRMLSYLSHPDFSDALGQVRMILSAGEILTQSLVSELKACYGIRVYNGYGPTEVTIGATITGEGDDQTVGAPIANTGIFILNENAKIVPFGAVGEICVYGAGVGIGYRGREEETQSKFVEWHGKRLYRTGDLGNFTEEGKLMYHGRTDRQVKLRGLRIELSEIEKVMGSYDGVLQTCCILKKINRSDHVIGFYTTDKNKTVHSDALREYIKKSLAAYMAPDVLKELEDMPQTPGGKLDLKALEKEPVEFTGAYRAPKSKAESVICGAFSAVLHREKVGADDNFFELGGDSLLASELMLEIEQGLALEEAWLDFSDIYKYPTPALLAEKVGRGREEPDEYAIDVLDYTEIDAFLSEHTASFKERHSLGNILLTGATGYLGIHILMALLKRPELCDRIYCLVRPNGRLSAENRVKSALFYYDEPDFAESCGVKWFAAEGDIAVPEIFKDPLPGRIDLIINSAANVAHFAYGDALERVNTGGVKNLINFAAREKASLCQISTISVGGVYKGTCPVDEFTENNLYVGQTIYNQYIYSKFLAEYELLQAAARQGIPVKIMRVGNLQGRSHDGEFQMNLKSNAFTRRLSSYIKMQAVPRSVYEAGVNFAPVDETARMIVALAGVDCRQSVFHVYPPVETAFADIFAELDSLGFPVRILEDAQFEELLQSLKRTSEGKAFVEGVLIERPDGRYRDVPVDQTITRDLLARLGAAWRPVTKEYLLRYLSSLNGLDMF